MTATPTRGNLPAGLKAPNKLWLMIAREYHVAVMRKAFWIGLILGPAFMAFMFIVPTMMLRKGADKQKQVIVIDRSQRVYAPLADLMAKRKLKNGLPEYVLESAAPQADSTAQLAALNARVLDGSLSGYLVIDQDYTRPNGLRYYLKNTGDVVNMGRVESSVSRAIMGLRLQDQNLSLTPEQLDKVTKGSDLQTFKVSEGGKTEKKGFDTTYITTFAFVFFLYMTILIQGITALRGILEEKSSRIIEVLLSSVTPMQLMLGKIIGFFLVGMTQVGFYALIGTVLSLVGVSSAGSEAMKQVAAALSPMLMGYFVLYFLLGFFLFMSMFVAIGSMVNSEQDAQAMQQPIVMALVIPMALTIVFVNQPDSLMTRIVSLIPIFTPMVMFMRISVQTPPFWEIALSIVLTVAATIGVAWAAARVFRVGILMYGKRPTLPEIMQWIKS